MVAACAWQNADAITKTDAIVIARKTLPQGLKPQFIYASLHRAKARCLPRRLKPQINSTLFGTAEAVPLRKTPGLKPTSFPTRIHWPEGRCPHKSGNRVGHESASVGGAPSQRFYVTGGGLVDLANAIFALEA
jgi:hypothetical protein